MALKKCLGLFALIVSGIIVAHTNITFAAAPVTVKACGEIKGNQGDASLEKRALDKACKKAVSKALARFVPPSKDLGSPYQSILQTYNKYVLGKPKVYAKNYVQGKLLLFCDVPINMDLLSQDIKTLSSATQRKNINEEMTFMLRVNGASNPQAMDDIITREYWAAFREIGLSADDKNKNDNPMVGISYSEYRESKLNFLQMNFGINFAVVGEVNLINLVDFGNSATAQVSCIAEIVKPQDDGQPPVIVDKFMDEYSVNAINKEEAEKLAFSKAARNSSKYLADMTYKYWQNNKN